MAYIMLAIGALMAVAGAYAAITGYSIIQVEQGWATVIAGASLTAGGIVTIAVALVLRALQALHKVLAEPRDAPALVERSEVPTLGMPAKAPAAETPQPPSEPEENLLPAPEPDRDRLFGAPPTSDDYKLETPSTPEHDLVPPPRPARTPPKSVPADDWLDRAFAEFDQEVSDPIAKPRTSLVEPRASLVEQRAPEPEPAPPPPEPIAQSMPAAAPLGTTIDDAGAAVIGRYEADGTSYVMYADGSIEAQTYSGVYRFASMAELKAFIES